MENYDIINSIICIYSYRLVKKCFLKICETSNFLIVSPGRYCRRILWIQQCYAAAAASHSCVRSNSCISWRISFKFCMEVYLGKIYTPIVFGDAAPSVPSFIGSKVIFCKSASWGIFRIGKLRRLLNKASTERLVHAFVSSHLDYCNSLLAGLPISYLSPLQRSQNTAARMVTLTKKRDNISPTLRSLHWLPGPFSYYL